VSALGLALLSLLAARQAPRPDLVITPATLARWLAEERPGQVVVIQAGRDRAAYDSAHVAGAHFLALSRFAVTAESLPSELPPVPVLDSLLESVGVSDSNRVVLYGEPLAASRLFFTLDYLGLGDRTYWLDGGVAAWRAVGQPVASEAAPATPGSLTPRLRKEVVVDAGWVSRRLDDPKVVLLDARTPDEYAGRKQEEGVDRPGHIPGAVNLDWQALLQDGKLKPIGELERQFAEAGARRDGEVVTYCRVGTRGSFLYLVSRLLGYRTLLYDGSMVDWARRGDLPVTTGPTPR
jgi:thiosulfate/3-mercaptopyruvate sulfurtransferase